jgi:hypothetical protein
MAAHGNVIALETMNKTMELLKNTENGLFFGDSNLIPEQWDGLERLITDGAPDNVIDLRGAALTEEALNDMLLQIRDNFGMATDCYFSTGAFADLAKQVYDRQRFAYAPAPGVLGATITAFQGQHGRVNLHDHVFIQEGPVALAAAWQLPMLLRNSSPPTPARTSTGSSRATASGSVPRWTRSRRSWLQPATA